MTGRDERSAEFTKIPLVGDLELPLDSAALLVSTTFVESRRRGLVRVAV